MLRALGVPAARAHGTLRFGLSRFTTEAEIDQAIAIVRDGVERCGPSTRARARRGYT